MSNEITEALFDLSMALDRLGNAAASSIGINQTDLICLNLLVRRGPLSPSVIASELGLTTAAISAVARRLEAGGYASREIDAADRRRILMSASPDGTRKAFGLFDDLYEATAALTANIRPAELRRLQEMLHQYQEIVLRTARALSSSRPAETGASP